MHTALGNMLQEQDDAIWIILKKKTYGMNFFFFFFK